MKVGRSVLIFLTIWHFNISIGSRIPTDFTALSSLLQSRIKRDDDYHVKCHQSGTGKK